MLRTSSKCHFTAPSQVVCCRLLLPAEAPTHPIGNLPLRLPAGARRGASTAPGRVAAELCCGVDEPPSGAPGASSAPSVSPLPSAHQHAIITRDFRRDGDLSTSVSTASCTKYKFFAPLFPTASPLFFFQPPCVSPPPFPAAAAPEQLSSQPAKVFVWNECTEWTRVPLHAQLPSGCRNCLNLLPAFLLPSSSSGPQFASCAGLAAALGPPWLQRDGERSAFFLCYKQGL